MRQPGSECDRAGQHLCAAGRPLLPVASGRRYQRHDTFSREGVPQIDGRNIVYYIAISSIAMMENIGQDSRYVDIPRRRRRVPTGRPDLSPPRTGRYRCGKLLVGGRVRRAEPLRYQTTSPALSELV
jgi:hypothetical protein